MTAQSAQTVILLPNFASALRELLKVLIVRTDLLYCQMTIHDSPLISIRHKKNLKQSKQTANASNKCIESHTWCIDVVIACYEYGTKYGMV